MLLSDPASAAAYLAAMIDGEGHVTICTDKTRIRAVRITNTDPRIIQAIERCCETLHLTFDIDERRSPSRPQHWKRAWDVTLRGRKNLEHLQHVVHLQSKKQERLAALIGSYKNSKRPSNDELRHMYETDKMSFTDIMRVTGARSTATVRYWLITAKINPRTLSAAGKQNWERRRRLHAVP